VEGTPRGKWRQTKKPLEDFLICGLRLQEDLNVIQQIMMYKGVRRPKRGQESPYDEMRMRRRKNGVERPHCR